MMRTICVVGLGEIGGQVLLELTRRQKKDNVFGVDIDPGRVAQLKSLGCFTGEVLPNESDIWIITVWSTDQIVNVLARVERAWLISIESTLDPSRLGEITEALDGNLHDALVTCPHRFNPNDPDHHIFNQDRIIGGLTAKALERGIEFYSEWMPGERLHEATFQYAAMAKVMENAYRYMEIVLAQEMRTACHAAGVSFTTLRNLVNTKWNVEVREARDGIGGKCLPKDMMLWTKAFSDSPLWQMMADLNERYKSEVACGVS